MAWRQGAKVTGRWYCIRFVIEAVIVLAVAVAALS
jgi:hypothetical protein